MKLIAKMQSYNRRRCWGQVEVQLEELCSSELAALLGAAGRGLASSGWSLLFGREDGIAC